MPEIYPKHTLFPSEEIESASPAIAWSVRFQLSEMDECAVAKKTAKPRCFLWLDVLDCIISDGARGVYPDTIDDF
jgi:hypothetical protein